VTIHKTQLTDKRDKVRYLLPRI